MSRLLVVLTYLYKRDILLESIVGEEATEMDMTEEGIWNALLEKTKSGEIKWSEVHHGNGLGDEPFRGNTEFASFISGECRIVLSNLNELRREGFELFVSYAGQGSCKFSAETDSSQNETAEELYELLESTMSEVADASELHIRERVTSKLASLLSR